MDQEIEDELSALQAIYSGEQDGFAFDEVERRQFRIRVASIEEPGVIAVIVFQLNTGYPRKAPTLKVRSES